MGHHTGGQDARGTHHSWHPSDRGRRLGAFTLLEVMVVLVLVGLLAGAVSWTAGGAFSSAKMDDAVGRLVYVDRLTRGYAQRFGRPCRIEIDIRAGTIGREVDRVGKDHQAPRDTAKAGHRVSLPRGYQIKRVLGPGGDRVRSGTVRIPCSVEGHTPTYAVLIASEDEKQQWVLVAGATGQVLRVDDEDRVDALFKSIGR